MNQFVALPDLGPSTLLSFSADTSLPPTQVEDWTAPTWSDSWGEAKRTVDGASSSLPSSSHEPTRTKWAAAAASANRQQYRVSRRFERRREELGLTFRKALEDDLEDLSDQEDRVYRAEANLRATGEDVLVPIGRLQTAQDAAHMRSESPSDPGERDAQEDFAGMGVGVNMMGQGGGGNVQEGVVQTGGGQSFEEEEEEVQDLDADIEDRDDTGDGSVD